MELVICRKSCPSGGMCLAVWLWDIPILPCQHPSLHMKCGLSRTCSRNALVEAWQWEMAYWGELHSFSSLGTTSVLAAEDNPNIKTKNADLKICFSQIPPISETIIPLIAVCINKYEVSARFSSLHFLAQGKLQGFVTSRAFSLPWRCRVSSVLLIELSEVKFCPYKLPLHSSKTFSGCTTHPVIAIPDNKMTEGEHLSKRDVVI